MPVTAQPGGELRTRRLRVPPTFGTYFRKLESIYSWPYLPIKSVQSSACYAKHAIVHAKRAIRRPGVLPKPLRIRSGATSALRLGGIRNAEGIKGELTIESH
jgi:hypothetical protein